MSRLLSALLPAHAALTAALESPLCSAASLREESASAPPSHSGITADLILCKYIIVERDGREYPIVFHRDLQHSDVLSPKAGTPVSAGFYQFISDDVILAGGESETLNLKARPQDAEIIKRHLLFPSL